MGIGIVFSDEAKRFFLSLGFKEGDSSDLSGEWISAIVGLRDVRARYVALSLPGAGASVELIQYHSPPPGRDPLLGRANQIGFRHLALAVDDIETEVRRLKATGIAFLSPIKTYEKTGKKLVYFQGPAVTWGHGLFDTANRRAAPATDPERLDKDLPSRPRHPPERGTGAQSDTRLS